jgi:TonB family protein
MNTTMVNFLIESGISLTILTLVYLLFLRKETFFLLNRIYLLVSVFFSFLLPFLHIQLTSSMPSFMLGEVTVTAPKYQNLLQAVTVYGTKLSGTLEQTIQSIGWIRMIYLAGIAFFVFLFIFRLLQIILLVINNESETVNGVKIVKIDRDITPFSFFNFVFVSRNSGQCREMNVMLAHELEHVRQGHSFDVLILELITIFQWFNPIVWLLKRSIRENHEFLADNGVLKPGVSSATYRLLLLGGTLGQQPVIANNFNYSMIKLRIKMMTKIKSPKTAAIKLSMGILVTASLFMVFAFDKDETNFSEKRSTVQPVSTIVSNQQEKVYDKVEQMPEFPGGEYALKKHISSEVKYPTEAAKAGIQGKVYVTFVITKEGKVTDAKIVKSANPLLDQEALRVIGSLPNWTPGKEKGVNVAVAFTLPIQFALK